jgi:hypothetical protein
MSLASWLDILDICGHHVSYIDQENPFSPKQEALLVSEYLPGEIGNVYLKSSDYKLISTL